MKKAAIQPRKPQEMANILNGKQTVIIVKRVPKWVLETVRANIATDDIWGGVDVYCYCTKGKPYLHKSDGIEELNIPNHYFIVNSFANNIMRDFNGSIPCKFTLRKIQFHDTELEDLAGNCGVSHIMPDDFLYLDNFTKLAEEKGCVSREGFIKYFGDEDSIGYALHISDLEIFDKPMELGEFYKHKIMPYIIDYDLTNEETQSELSEYEEALEQYKLTRAPQSMQTVWVDD